jgi:hypothetical protein
MKRALAGWFLVLLCVAWLTLGCHTNQRTPALVEPSCDTVAPAPADDRRAAGPRIPAPQFELADQFGTTHEFRFPRDKVTVLTVCGRKGSDDVAPWTTALGQRFGDAVLLQGIADVGGAPGIMRGLIRAMFRKEVKFPVMLDWSGAHSAAFQYDRQTVTVYVVDRAGFIVRRAGGPATPEALAPVIAAIEDLLAAPGEPQPSH